MGDDAKLSIGLETESEERLLTNLEKERIIQYADANVEIWQEWSGNLLKWLFATLITINLGGLAFAINSNVHPDAINRSIEYFYVALVFTLIAGLIEIYRISKLKYLAFEVKYETTGEGGSYKLRDYRMFFGNWSHSYLSLFAGFISLGLFLIGGTALSEGMTPCDAKMLEYGLREGSNTYPIRNGTKYCYFYEIDGLPNDPLERAKTEIKLMKSLKDKSQTSSSYPSK